MVVQTHRRETNGRMLKKVVGNLPDATREPPVLPHLVRQHRGEAICRRVVTHGSTMVVTPGQTCSNLILQPGKHGDEAPCRTFSHRRETHSANSVQILGTPRYHAGAVASLATPVGRLVISLEPVPNRNFLD